MAGAVVVSSKIPVPQDLPSVFRRRPQFAGRANTALRDRLAEIEAARKACRRCGEKKPPILFRPSDRTCLHCRIEIPGRIARTCAAR